MTSRAVHSALESLETRRLFATTPAGSLDTNFAGTGYAEAFGPGAIATSVTKQGDDIVAVGVSADGSLALARYSSSGNLELLKEFNDLSFGISVDDRVEPNVVALGEDTAASADDFIFITGTTTGGDIFAVSLNADGSYNTSFNGGSAFVLSTLSATESVAGAAVKDGFVYITGSSPDGAYVARFDDAGLDVDFAGAVNGLQILTQSVPSGTVAGIAASSDSIVVASTDTLFFLDGDGLDTGTFAQYSSATYGLDLYDVTISGGDVYATGAVLDIDSNSDTFGSIGVGVWKYDADNTSSFGTDDVATIFTSETAQGLGITVDASGIVVGGLATDGGNLRLAVARFTAEGAADSTFDGDGLVVSTQFGDSVGYDVTISEGNILVVGGGANGMVAARYLSFDEVSGSSPVEYEAGVLTISGTEAINTVTVTASGNSVFVTLNMVDYGPFTLASGDTIVVNTADGADNISFASSVTFATSINAGAGNDTVQGGAGADNINAGAGNDLVGGGAGNDFISGGAGLDAIGGQAGSDIILGGDGVDAVSGGSGRDIIVGGGASDVISGDTEDDVIVGASTDLTDAELLQVRAIWTSALTYTQRVNTLLAGLLSPSNVVDDGSLDVLIGGSGTDWFLYNNDGGAVTRDLIVDRSGLEVRTDVD